VCCKGQNGGKLTAKSARNSTLLTWFPVGSEEILQHCARRYPGNRGFHMQPALIDSMVRQPAIALELHFPYPS
jgi:hypothetical protein